MRAAEVSVPADLTTVFAPTRCIRYILSPSNSIHLPTTHSCPPGIGIFLFKRPQAIVGLEIAISSRGISAIPTQRLETGIPTLAAGGLACSETCQTTFRNALA